MAGDSSADRPVRLPDRTARLRSTAESDRETATDAVVWRRPGG